MANVSCRVPCSRSPLTESYENRIAKRDRTAVTMNAKSIERNRAKTGSSP